jgi:H+/Cl- antiporter ClcA
MSADDSQGALAPAPAQPAPAAPPTPPLGKLSALIALGLVVGLVAGGGAALFVAVEHSLQHWLWNSLPEILGHEVAPAWLVVALLVTGAVLVFAASHLPGHGGHSPLDGFGLDIGPREVGSVILAALASLSFGASLGPEAPLIAIGTALGAMAVRDTGSPARKVAMLVGGMGAVGAIFGNPLITVILMLEMAVMAGPLLANTAVLVPALAGLSSGYVLQVGIAAWSGLGEVKLAMPGLPAYPEVEFVDLALSIPLAVLVAIVGMGARLGAIEVRRMAKRSPLPTIVGAGVVVAVSAITVSAITGGDLDLVLFSGQSAMLDYLAITSVGTALVVLAGKFIAYAASMGSGFRGGPIFPAIAMGVILAAVAHDMVGGSSTSALAATAIAAATAACMRLPFTAVLLGALLTSSAGGATTVLAIIGAIIGLLARLYGDQHVKALAPPEH